MSDKEDVYEEFIRRIVVHANSMHDVAREVANMDRRYPGIFDQQPWAMLFVDFILKYK